jgi:hypothetical protein
MPPDKATEEESLRRLGGGRWQTRDERFTIEPQSGTWAIVDAEQTDELGLPLVRGPYPSLTAAKAAIAGARASAAPTSPLKERPKPAPAPSGSSPKGSAGTAAKETTKPARAPKAKEPDEPEEPRWFRDLEPDDRRRAARLIDRLTAAGAADSENLVRRDLVGEVPAIAGYAIAKAVRALGDAPSPADVAELLGEGRDSELGVRWRLVDDDGRPIRLERRDLEGG